LGRPVSASCAASCRSWSSNRPLRMALAV
jgi:hypothetical protein